MASWEDWKPKERISVDRQYMLHALVAALRSTCGRLQVGCVLVKGDDILSSGRNGAPRGLPHCSCGPEAPCTASVHAEANAIAFAARKHGGAEGATLYSTHAPCEACAGMLINTGIVRVAFLHQYRSDKGISLLWAAQVRVHQLSGTFTLPERPT